MWPGALVIRMSVLAIMIALKLLLLVIANVWIEPVSILWILTFNATVAYSIASECDRGAIFSLERSSVLLDGAAILDSTMSVQEATAEEIWENAVHIHADPVSEAFVVADETLEVVEVVSFVDALVIF
jgi:hypothetical protein